MIEKHQSSRREFLKKTSLASLTIVGTSTLAACNLSPELRQKRDSFPVFKGEGFSQKSGVSGLLFSQIGYELGWPVRVIVRLPQKELFQGKISCKLKPSHQEKSYKSDFDYWGEIWGSHWWIADFSEIKESGEWDIEVMKDNQCVFKDGVLRVGKGLLWKETIEFASVDMLERRVHFTKVGAGWQDAGCLWVESPAQSAMVISLTELLETSYSRFDQPFVDRIHKQITVGCDYLVMLQAKAKELGFQAGSMCHDLHGQEMDVLPNDAMKAVIALAKAAQLLPDKYTEKKLEYSETAKKAFQWLTTLAKPMGEYGYMKMQRGLAANAVIPKDEWLTRDLLTMCAACLEMTKLGNNSAKEQAVELARKVMARQIPKEKAESAFYGHFYEFDSMSHSEPAWIHGIVPNEGKVEFGADIGGVYPNYLLPIIELGKLLPNHPDAPKWKDTLHNFAYNYLIPACEHNPFLLVPQGIFGNDGPVWFCGTFHGTNAIYGYTAALALELAKFLNEPKLKEIAYGNLQWLAGLNGGITQENLKQGCVIFSTDIPDGAALPASMMCGVGKRWAGTWFQTRGVICNGFSTGKQFVYDTEPKKANDGPNSFTDEDWIPHSAAWLTGLIRL